MLVLLGLFQDVSNTHSQTTLSLWLLHLLTTLQFLVSVAQKYVAFNQMNKRIDKYQKRDYSKLFNKSSATFSVYSHKKPKDRILENELAVENLRKCHEVLKGMELKKGKLLRPARTQKLLQIMNQKSDILLKRDDLTTTIRRPLRLGEKRNFIEFMPNQYFNVPFPKSNDFKNVQTARFSTLFKKKRKNLKIKPFERLEESQSQNYGKEKKKKKRHQTVWKLGKYQLSNCLVSPYRWCINFGNKFASHRRQLETKGYIYSDSASTG